MTDPTHPRSPEKDSGVCEVLNRKPHLYMGRWHMGKDLMNPPDPEKDSEVCELPNHTSPHYFNIVFSVRASETQSCIYNCIYVYNCFLKYKYLFLSPAPLL